jgi:hypothetical protein
MTVWHVKLPSEWKAIFEEIAANAGYRERGAPATEVRKILRAWLKKEGMVE